MKLIAECLFAVMMFVVIGTRFLWLFSAHERESLPHVLGGSHRADQVDAVQPGHSFLPELMAFLPNLLNNSNQTHISRVGPVLKVSQHRSNVSLVIGIPSVKRNNNNYLFSTLKGFLSAMTVAERNKVLIVILLCDLDAETVRIRYSELSAQFGREISSGLIDVVSPPLSFYPDLDHVKLTLGDKRDRVKWRTKQALDFAYIMMYAMNRGEYFLQLEDDIAAVNQFTTKILEFVQYQDLNNPDWMYIQFSNLGYIGKLFHNHDLLGFSAFYLLFHATKPVDWLLPEYVVIKMCRQVNVASISSSCKDSLSRAILTHSPSLFQHTGYYSSLEGKIQPLEDKDFPVGDLGTSANSNPLAILRTSLKAYDSNSLNALYRKSGFLWAYPPVIGDYIEIKLMPPVALCKFEVTSGIEKAPSDILQGATFEIQPANATASLKPNGTLPDFFSLASFNKQGAASGPISPVFGNIQVVRVNVVKNHTNWVAIKVFDLLPCLEEDDTVARDIRPR